MNSASVTTALRVLAQTVASEEHAYASVFTELANLLLERTTLYVAGRPYRFTELELYYRSDAHDDPFTHGDPLQKQLGYWYFHRSGGTYRSGTYKGLDITFGDGAAFGGVLIRGLECLDDAALIDGPCVVVDHLLEVTGVRSIDALVRSLDGTIENTGRSPLYVELASGPRRAVYATPRVGLSLKKENTERRHRFIARPYRFLSEPARIKKGKPHLITSLARQHRAPAEIASLTGTRLSVVERYLHAFDSGRRRSIAEFCGDLSTSELCALFGACAERDEA